MTRNDRQSSTENKKNALAGRKIKAQAAPNDNYKSLSPTADKNSSQVVDETCRVCGKPVYLDDDFIYEEIGARHRSHGHQRAIPIFRREAEKPSVTMDDHMEAIEALEDTLDALCRHDVDDVRMMVEQVICSNWLCGKPVGA